MCLELSKGPLVYALQKYDFLVLFPVNPATLAKYCYAFTPSHAKDDPTDADLQIEVLTQYRDKLKPLRLQGASMRTLQHLVIQRRGLVDDRVRIANRLTSNHGSTLPTCHTDRPQKETGGHCRMPMTEPPADRRALEVIRADPALIGTRRLSIEAPSFYGRYA